MQQRPGQRPSFSLKRDKTRSPSLEGGKTRLRFLSPGLPSPFLTCTARLRNVPASAASFFTLKSIIFIFQREPTNSGVSLTAAAACRPPHFLPLEAPAKAATVEGWCQPQQGLGQELRNQQPIGGIDSHGRSQELEGDGTAANYAPPPARMTSFLRGSYGNVLLSLGVILLSAAAVSITAAGHVINLLRGGAME